jgi:catechol 2,3-dioxygenase-like lactoylglutathione lyase family enzyme
MSSIIPIFRIFDYEKAVEFYTDWLGFKIDWETRFEDNAPVYMQVSRGDIQLHLSEHSGDGTPGSKAYVHFSGLEGYHKELIEKKYKYNRPGIYDTPWGTRCVDLIDPFHNVLSLNELKK